MALVQAVENGKIKESTTETTTSAGNDLGYDEFLQLLCAEMQYQDPLEPTSNTEYVAQLATFSQMESMLNMQNSIESTKANDLVGKYVIVKTTSETTGETKAKVGFIDYNQAVHNVRVVTSDSVFTEAISTSMFVKLGEQKYFKDGAILVRKASSISGDTATWSDQIVAISQQDYQDAYGQDPRNLSNYVISRDTVQNPSMTANADGTYTLTFDLEPEGASAYYRHQVRTYSGAAKNPEFTAVHMVWTIDANWDLLQMDTVESYTVSMSGLGSLNCTSTLTEVFTDFGAVTDDQTEFQHYLETEYDPNNLGKLSDGGQDTQAMVRDFFRRTPNYSVTVTANGQSYGLTAHVDIDQTTLSLIHI